MRVCRKLSAVVLFLLPSFALCAQSSSGLSMPDGPTMPSMPSITSPSLSGGFYAPGRNTTTTKKANSSVSKTESSITSETTKSESIKQTLSAVQLSANDISSLGSMGLLGNLTSAQNTSGEATTALLQQILSEIAELKKQVAETQAALKERNIVTTAEDSTESAEVVSNEKVSLNLQEKQENSVPRSAASLLRFTVNGYSLISTCRTVYVSDTQADGSFLVTGDRRYLSNGLFYTETFYLLFRPSGAQNGTETYTVAASVSQDKNNPYSYVYRLSLRPTLTASRTGNLVSLQDHDDRWNADILLDIGRGAASFVRSDR